MPYVTRADENHRWRVCPAGVHDYAAACRLAAARGHTQVGRTMPDFTIEQIHYELPSGQPGAEDPCADLEKAAQRVLDYYGQTKMTTFSLRYQITIERKSE